jgi:hypothetical protein
MSRDESYRGKSFTIADPDARIRKADDLMAFEPAPGGGFRAIANGKTVRIDAVSTVAAGTNATLIFVHAVEPSGEAIGWTSAGNLKGKFVNETLGRIEPSPGASKFGPNAAWSGGVYQGQRVLVTIVDASRALERVALDTLDAYFDMVDAAAAAGVSIAINSGFRSYAEQKHLYDGHVKKLPGFNLAAKPGSSKHQNGVAFDIPVAGGTGNPTYDWLRENATAHGFVRTVSKEPWHWEYDPVRAKAAAKAGTFKTPNVTV